MTPAADRSLVLVGLMGAGKTSIGKRLAARLELPFVDADAEIEKAAGMTVSEIFAQHGEPYFRDGERRVIARLLEGPRQVLATGGGAFVDPENRARIKAAGWSIWLRATIDTLLKRVKRRGTRPLLSQGDPRAVLERLMAERHPFYAEADIVIDSGDGPHETVVESIVQELNRRATDHA
ncbi:MAG: shikimate kinase [Alphaproteobacteria bacterium]|nr:shikimate kinase [Alphaproteobacteria bacterium]